MNCRDSIPQPVRTLPVSPDSHPLWVGFLFQQPAPAALELPRRHHGALSVCPAGSSEPVTDVYITVSRPQHY